MQVAYFTIAGGNKTALVSECFGDDRFKQVCHLLPTVEQIGFISGEDNSCLHMLGDELCINALLALALKLEAPEGTLRTNTQACVPYKNFDTKTQVVVTLPYQRIDDVILFEGIGFICQNEHKTVPKETLASYAHSYNLPAFGSLSYDKSTQIYPQVYVAKTGTVLDETACGSGSIAAHIMTGCNTIIQPTGEIISIYKDGGSFIVEATVRKL